MFGLKNKTIIKQFINMNALYELCPVVLEKRYENSPLAYIYTNGFALIRERYAFIRENFTLTREKIAFIRKIYFPFNQNKLKGLS